MKKKIQKPFDVEAAKKGAKIETKSGNSVRIICYDRKNPLSCPILALVLDGIDETCFPYNLDGSLGLYSSTVADSMDLVIIEEVEYPKFNPGDWVFMNTHGSQPWLVIKVTPNYYEIRDSFGHITAKSHSTIDSLFHPWTLRDAKPGDILCYKDNRPFMFKELRDGYPIAYFGIDYEDSILIGNGLIWTTDSVRPATSNEKDMLFKKMEEEGYEWDAETFTLTKKRWRDDENAEVNGYYIHSDSRIVKHSDYNSIINHNVFATKKQAKSALAMARISQIMKNDERFGGVVTDEEWNDSNWHVIARLENQLVLHCKFSYEFLAFHTYEQAKLFLKENEDLVKDYYMMD